MLIRDRRVYLLIFSILFYSCNNNIKEDNNINWKYYKNQNFGSYKAIYELANDSLLKWIKDSLGVTKACFFNKYQLDSLLILNKSQNRFYTTVNIRVEDGLFDEIQDFGGAKINGKWYFFFMGVSNPVRRENWQDSVYTPLTFEELSCISFESHFKKLVKNIQEGHPEKNEKYFDDMFFDYYECKDVKDKHFCSDTFTLVSVARKYKNKLVRKEIAEIKKAIAESKVLEGRSLVKPRSWWDKLQYGEKVFESEAWKDRHKIK